MNLAGNSCCPIIACFEWTSRLQLHFEIAFKTTDSAQIRNFRSTSVKYSLVFQVGIMKRALLEFKLKY